MFDNLLHRLAGPTPATPPQVSAARKAFQRLWVAGTLGAMFTALAKTIPGHMKQIGGPGPIDWYYTLEMFLRYAYFIWLIAYFFTSNLRTQSPEPPQKGDVWYDVAQSVSALVAAFFLDFLVTDVHHGRSAFIAANAATFLICFLALVYFPGDQHPHIQRLRAIGAVGSLISGLVAAAGLWFKSQSYHHLSDWILLGLLLPLFFVLGIFTVGRVRTMPVANEASNTQPRQVGNTSDVKQKTEPPAPSANTDATAAATKPAGDKK